MSKAQVDSFAEKLGLDEDTVLDVAEDEDDPKAFLTGHILDKLDALSKEKFPALKKSAKEDFKLTPEQIKEAHAGAEDKKAAVLQLIFATVSAEVGTGGNVSGSLTASEATLRAQGFAALPADQRQQIVQEALDGKRQGQWQILKPLGNGGQAMVYHITPAATAAAGSSPRGSGSQMERAFKVVPYVGVDTKGKLERCVCLPVYLSIRPCS
jgi:hypothetical protein